MPCSRISRLTWSRPTVSPLRRTAVHVRRVAVGVVVGRVDLLDTTEQPLVLYRPRRALTAGALTSRRTPTGQIRPPALIGLDLPHVTAQRLRRHAEITRNMRDGAAALDDDPRAA